MAGLAWACGEDTTGTATTVSVVEVSSPTNTLRALGASVTLKATARASSSGPAITGLPISWSSSRTSIVSVDTAGVATAVGEGTAEITAMVSGVSGSTTLEVVQVGARLSVVTQPTAAQSGVTFATSPIVEIRDQNGNVLVGNDSTIVTVAVKGNAVLRGQISVAAVDGVAKFDGLRMFGEADDAATMSFTAESFGRVLSAPFTFAAADSRIASATTGIDGRVAFLDFGTGDSVSVRALDGGSQPLANINVQFWDNSGFELFILEDSSGSFVTSFRIFEQSGDHDIGMSTTGPVVRQIWSGTPEYDALLRFEADETVWNYMGCVTPEALEAETPVYGFVIPELEPELITVTDAAGQFADATASIEDWDSPDCYLVSLLGPVEPIVTPYRLLLPATGDLVVRTTTSGTDVDVDGFSVALDVDSVLPISLDDSLLVTGLIARYHTVGLTGLAPNCSVGGIDPVLVHVFLDLTAEVDFSVTCDSIVRPIATISEPAPGAEFTPGEAITFNGSAVDADGAALTGSALVWTSDLDGEIGTGVSFERSDLRSGTHAITLTATDTAGIEGTASINVTIGPETGLALLSVSADKTHTCGFDTQNTGVCWGNNDFGQLGDGTTEGRLEPVVVAGGLRFAAAAAGEKHSCAILTDSMLQGAWLGPVYCWGDNTFGQVGDGTTTRRLTPTPVLGGILFEGVTAGDGHSCAFTPPGDAYCWGDNSYGQLGDGTRTGRLVPTAVSGGLTYEAVSAGLDYTCGVTNTGGDAYCWGSGSGGALGNGDASDRLVPTPVAVTKVYESISAGIGSRFTCAVTVSGEAFCWGDNSFGQLGDGTTTNRLTPTAVAGSINFASITTGGSHTCGVTPDNVGYCWGSNASGALGDGGTTDWRTPFPIAGGIMFKWNSFQQEETGAISAGLNHTCGMALLGQAYCWGGNSSGQLGVGDTDSRNQPVRVAEAK